MQEARNYHNNLVQEGRYKYKLHHWSLHKKMTHFARSVSFLLFNWGHSFACHGILNIPPIHIVTTEMSLLRLLGRWLGSQHVLCSRKQQDVLLSLSSRFACTLKLISAYFFAISIQQKHQYLSASLLSQSGFCFDVGRTSRAVLSQLVGSYIIPEKAEKQCSKLSPLDITFHFSVFRSVVLASLQ